MIEQLKNKLCKHFHNISFTTKKLAQILADELNKRSCWKRAEVKKCLFCKKYYAKLHWTPSAKRIRKELR